MEANIKATTENDDWLMCEYGVCVCVVDDEICFLLKYCNKRISKEHKKKIRNQGEQNILFFSFA
jgi:hypothetical protein